MSVKIGFVAQSVRYGFGGDGAKCRCTVVHNDVLTPDDMANDLAETMHIDVVEARHFASVVAQYIVRALGKGKKLDFGPFALYLTMRGTVDGAAGAFDPERNSLRVNIQEGSELRKQIAALRPVNTTISGGRPRIVSAIDTATKAQDTITPGAELFIAGANLVTPVDATGKAGDSGKGGKAGKTGKAGDSGEAGETGASDEGVWLVKDGARVQRGRITASSATTLNCVFDAAETLASGKYTLVLCTRSGNESQSAPSVIRRKIIVRNEE